MYSHINLRTDKTNIRKVACYDKRIYETTSKQIY